MCNTNTTKHGNELGVYSGFPWLSEIPGLRYWSGSSSGNRGPGFRLGVPCSMHCFRARPGSFSRNRFSWPAYLMGREPRLFAHLFRQGRIAASSFLRRRSKVSSGPAAVLHVFRFYIHSKFTDMRRTLLRLL